MKGPRFFGLDDEFKSFLPDEEIPTPDSYFDNRDDLLNKMIEEELTDLEDYIE